MKIQEYDLIKKRFGKKVPEKILFHSYKMYPKEFNYDYKKHRYYIYIYLDPFTSYLEHNQLGYIEKPEIFFGFEPFYVGKGTSGHGYRLNQHIQHFIKNKEKNEFKRYKMNEIQQKMFSNKYPDKPKNWKEFQDHFVMVYKAFDNEQDLMNTEKLLINKIGTIKNMDGPLVNKITNYDQKAIKRIEDVYYS